MPSMTRAADTVGRDPHRRPGVGQHQAAVEREVGGHRRHHHGAQAGREDGPPGREVVRRRTGRGGDDEPVGRVGETSSPSIDVARRTVCPKSIFSRTTSLSASKA